MKNSRGGSRLPPRGEEDDLDGIVQEDSLAQKIARKGRKAKPSWRKDIPPQRVPLEAGKLARAEEAAFADGSLERQAKENAHNRDQATKAFVHRSVLRAMLVVGCVFLAFFLVWGWHYIAPSGVTWLENSRFAGLDSLIQHLLSGAAGAFLFKQIDKHMQ